MGTVEDAFNTSFCCFTFNGSPPSCSCQAAFIPSPSDPSSPFSPPSWTSPPSSLQPSLNSSFPLTPTVWGPHTPPVPTASPSTFSPTSSALPSTLGSPCDRLGCFVFNTTPPPLSPTVKATASPLPSPLLATSAATPSRFVPPIAVVLEMTSDWVTIASADVALADVAMADVACASMLASTSAAAAAAWGLSPAVAAATGLLCRSQTSRPWCPVFE